MTRFRSLLIIAASVLAATVAGLAFWVSFEAISAYAVQIGALPSSLRYCAPLLVDSFTMLGTAFLLWLALSGTPLRKTWDAYYAWALIIAATAGSAALNAAHVVPSAPTEARWVAGAVPVTLLASVHLLVLLLLRLLAWQPTTSEAGGRRPRQEQEREAGPTTTPPAPAASSPRVRPRSNREVEAPAPGGPVATKSTDRTAERARAVRAHLAEHPQASANQIKTALKTAGVGTGESGAFYKLVDRIKTEGNGSAPPEREQVEA